MRGAMTDRWTQARLDGRRRANHEKWREGIAEPEHRLMAAVIRRAVADVGSTPALARRARAYIAGDGFAADCAWIGIDPDYIRQKLEKES